MCCFDFGSSIMAFIQAMVVMATSCVFRRKRRARQDEGQMLDHQNAGKKAGKKAGLKDSEEGSGLFRRIIPGF